MNKLAFIKLFIVLLLSTQIFVSVHGVEHQTADHTEICNICFHADEQFDLSANSSGLGEFVVDRKRHTYASKAVYPPRHCAFLSRAPPAL